MASYTNYSFATPAPVSPYQPQQQYQQHQSSEMNDLLDFTSSPTSQQQQQSRRVSSDDLSVRPPTWEEQQQYDEDYARREAQRIVSMEQQPMTGSTTLVVSRSPSMDEAEEYARQEARRIMEAENSMSSSRSRSRRSSNRNQIVPAANTTAMVPHYSNTSPTTLTVYQPTTPNPQNETRGYSTTGVHPKRATMKKQRKTKAAGGAVGGAVVGGIILGPVGVVAGGMAGAAATNQICKAKEKKKQRRFEQAQFQKAATNSGLHRRAVLA